jgi:hypothetical protein
MKRSLVMTYLGEPPTLDTCLERIERQTVPIDEVIQIRGRPGRTESQDIAEGFAKARGDIIYTTNADCYLPIDFVEKVDRWFKHCFMLVSGVRGFRPLPNEGRTKMSPRLGITGSGLGFRRELLSWGVLPFVFSTGWDIEMAMKTGAPFVIDTTIRIYHDHPMTPAYLIKKAPAYVARNLAMAFVFGGFRSIDLLPRGYRL